MVDLTHICLKHYIYSFVFILIAGCVASTGIGIDVYRLIQYDISGAPFGSRVASLNHFARSSISAASASDLSRSVIILYLYEFNETFLQEYIEGGKPLGGLLVLLPHVFRPDNTRTTPCDSDYTLEKKQLAYLEQKLIHSTIQYPVYFAFEHQGLAKVLADIRRNDAVGKPATTATGGYKLVVTSPTPKKRGISTIINIQGWLPGLKADGDSKQLPTIAIVASYDTFGAVPALSVGSDSNGSGVVALLEIARLFSVLYSNSSTRGRYNILFALTSAGPYNYNGTHTWLRSLDQRLLESIDYAICLNSLGSTENKLWLHTSKPPENTYVKQIFEGLSNVAKELDIDVGLKHKELNVSNSRVAWEHEHFSRLGVTAATLSRLSVAPNFLEVTGGISDKIEFIKEEAIVQSVKLVTRCLARQIYGQEGKNLLADKSGEAVNHLYIKSLLHFLSKSPRVAPYIFFDITSLVAVKRIYEELAHHVVEVRNRYGDIDDQMFTFYDSAVNTLHISQVAGVSSNMFWKPILGEYLFALLFLFIFTGMRVILYVLYLCGKVEALCRVQNEQDH